MTSAPPISSHPAADKKTFVIGTRQSKLALLQTDLVREALKEAYPEYSFEILSKETAGDLNTTIAFREFNSKNLWTEELEELLIAGEVDFIVHSLKGAYTHPFPIIPCYPSLILCPSQMFRPSSPPRAHLAR